MTFFQLLLIIGVLGIAVFSMTFVKGERSLAMKRLFALIAAAAAIVAILFPDLLTLIAHFLGIGRGADLLLYVFVIVSMLFAVSTMRAKARSDARVTELARSVALMEARLNERLDDSGVGPNA
ncbi:DUF2304 domain-containing protein [Leucobacter chinensis]|uniref:DUF2304 domain-containing protein n=1 Tax=Leucobacter chinensis TaxID=2851010 RepID=UPI001C2247FE|nr:DUF2304 domain-containing protein [Leucobacter chinensis]